MGLDSLSVFYKRQCAHLHCSRFVLPMPFATWQYLRSRRINHKKIVFYSYFLVLGEGSFSVYVWARSQPMREERCYKCNVFSHWLRPSSDICRNRGHLCNRPANVDSMLPWWSPKGMRTAIAICLMQISLMWIFVFFLNKWNTKPQISEFVQTKLHLYSCENVVPKLWLIFSGGFVILRKCGLLIVHVSYK